MNVVLGRIWARVAGFGNFFSTRLFLALAALVLALFSFLHPVLTSVDRLPVQLALYFSESDELLAPRTALITVPADELAVWQRDAYAASNFSSLLANVLESPKTSVGILLREPLRDEANTLDNLLTQSAFKTGSEQDLYLNHKQYLHHLVRDQRVVMGLRGVFSETGHDIALMQHNNLAETLQKYLAQYAPCENCPAYVAAESDMPYFYFPERFRYSVPFFVNAGTHLEPNFFTAATWTHLGVKTELSKLDWDRYTGLQSQSAALPLSFDGTLFPRSLNSENAAQVSALTMREAMVTKTFPDFVVIASEEDYSSGYIAAAIVSDVLEEKYYVVSWWFSWALALTYILLGLLLYFVLPRIKNPQIYWGSGFTFCFVLIVAEMTAPLFSHFLLPLSLLLGFTLSAFVLLSVWSHNRAHLLRYQAQLHRRILSTANLLEAAANYREAIELLAVLPNYEKQRDKLLRVVDLWIERESNFREALDTLHQIRDEQGDSTQIAKKISQLKAMAAAESNPLAETGYRGTGELLPAVLGRYEIQRELGRGAVGIVYLGYDPAISRKVAIKTLNYRQFSHEQIEGLKARFFREAEAAGRLSHPNIVSIYDVGEQNDLAYIAMDYVDGQPLSSYVSEETLLPMVDVYRIIHDVALALDYAHSHQVVHRDIKPGNILYCPAPYQVKVADFGIARLLDNSRTATGEILGSPLYMAPEQLKGKKVDVPADIFSLGVTFYQLLVGKLPFHADNLAGLTYEIIHSKHKSLKVYRKDLPASAVRIVNQCLQKDPDERYESALELASVIKKAIRRDFPNEARDIGFD